MSEYDEGDLIEAVKGDTVIRARLQRDPAGYKNPLAIFTVALHADVRHLEANGYKVTVLEKAAPPLPTEPGHYLDKDGDHWELPRIGELDPRYAPYARLEPVPVTVQKVIELLESAKIIQSDGEVARSIREIFGVS